MYKELLLPISIIIFAAIVFLFTPLFGTLFILFYYIILTIKNKDRNDSNIGGLRAEYLTWLLIPIAFLFSFLLLPIFFFIALMTIKEAMYTI